MSQDAVGLLLDQITEQFPDTRQALRKLKTAVAATSGSPLVRNDRLLARYRLDVAAGRRPTNSRLERLLTLNRIRSESGVAIVTVITEPYACPGRCVYCPTEARAPKSYLTNEPAVMRAVRNDYDPYRQVRTRLETLRATGHATDKVELIIKGGTWSFYPKPYQQEFVQRCVEAANDFAQGSRLKAEGGSAHLPRALSLEPRADSMLEEVFRRNETAACRIIGMTVETRPDYIDEAEIRRLRALGVTRVELGVQTLDETVLHTVVRDHGTAAVRRATQLLKDAGFKVAYHIMPNLPGATPASDLESFARLFDDPAYQPDTLKLYPCVVIETAELYGWWVEGHYVPYDDETLIDLLIHMKRLVPPTVRIERVVRDIPSTSIRAGSRITNLREEIHRRMRARGLRCRCIRCRQVRGTVPARLTLRRRVYAASDGVEIFLSFEDPVTDQLCSFLRLRLPACAARCPTRLGAAGRPACAEPPTASAGAAGRPSQALDHEAHWLPVLTGAALIRELHTYGQHLPLATHDEDAPQHQGLGSQLMREAERIAHEEFGLGRMAVIAGVGVREYYRRFGYELQDTYMVKTLDKKTPRITAGRLTSCWDRGA